MTTLCQAPLSMEFFRRDYWSGLPFPSHSESILASRFTEITVTRVISGIKQWFLNVGPRPAASATPGNLLGIQVLGPHPRLTLGTACLGRSPKICIWSSPPALFKNHCCNHCFYWTAGLVTCNIIQKVEIQSSQMTEFLNFPNECLKIPKADLGKLIYSWFTQNE